VLAEFEGELGSDGRGPRAPERLLPQAFERAGVALHRRGRGLPGAPLDARLETARDHGISDMASLLREEPSGTGAARRRLRAFVDDELLGYAERRNKPELDATSRLSAFVHFGQLSPHEILAAVRASEAPAADVAAFVEEFVVRRELACNLVRWNPLAAQLDGAPDWARRTLAAHAADPREARYDDDELAAGDTHDPLWNAAQRQLLERGHMHGYLRMYWAKQVLLWREDPADAFDVTLRLNDRYSLDGRDPNGITGVAWAIGGTHDRPWTERAVFGTIRSMTLRSTGRKFDSRAYIERWGGVRGAAATTVQ
jgi:deoxyribodipyrimidine photo-lyase